MPGVPYIAVSSVATATSIFGFTSTVVSNSTQTLDASSTFYQEYTGTVPGQIVKLPDATTVILGFTIVLINDSNQILTVQDGGSNQILLVAANQGCWFKCVANGTSAGTWELEDYDQLPGQNLTSRSNVQDDFVAGTATGVTTLGQLRWIINVTGTGAAIVEPSANTDQNHIGVVNMAVGAVGSISNIAIASVNLGGGQYILEFLIRTGALGTATQNYVLQFGLGDNLFTTADMTDGVFFEYSQAANTAFRFRCGNASTYTNTVSSTTVAANTWYKAKMIVNPAGSNVGFYLSPAGGGIPAFVANITTNIPTTPNIQPFFQIRKTVGTTVVSCDVDYFLMDVTLTNLR